MNRPVPVTIVQPEFHWTLIVESAVGLFARAWLIMVALPWATGGDFAPGYGASAAIAVLLGAVGHSNHELYTLPHSAWKQGRR